MCARARLICTRGMNGSTMRTDHSFGGDWTEKKLDTLQAYLKEYRKIFERNDKARFFRTVYVDAFAGTGYREDKDDDLLRVHLSEGEEAQGFRKGSARRALELESPFDEYVFIEKDSDHASELRKLKFEYPQLADRINVVEYDANAALQRFCQERDWQRERAVVFLDPYGMQVEWSTIEAIAETLAIDMWLLFPLGQGVNRLLTRDRLPPSGFAKRLTLTFGTDAWKDEFYETNPQGSLFSDHREFIKVATFDSIAQFFVRRLEKAFTAVAEDYRLLKNSQNVPIYMLCFAAANERGAKPAIRIASHLLKPH